MSTNGTSKATIDCPHCGQRFSVAPPKTGILNDLRCSLGVATHEKPIRCICGKYAIWVAQTVQMAWAIVPITDEQAAKLDESSILIPPPGMKIV